MYSPLSSFFIPPFAHIWNAYLVTQFATTKTQKTTGRKRIAIVGGGTAGLAALKTFIHDIPKAPGEEWDIVLFEQRPNVGGIWLADTKKPHEHQLPETPLYPRLRTNTPNPTMTFPGFPFPPLTPLFPGYQHLQAYHADYAEHYGLNSYIRLNQSVSLALWVGNSTKGYWDVTVQAGYPVEILPGSSLPSIQDQGGASTERFDHLVLATGHNHYPEIPEWARNSDWQEQDETRRIIHAINYRESQDYADRKVLVVGGGASGSDIVSQVREYAEKTYHSFRDNTKYPTPHLSNVIRKPRTSHLTRTSVVFEDGSEVSDIDIIILATGYQNRFPFLCPSDPYASNPAYSNRDGKSILVTDPNANSRPSGPLVSNLNYVFPVDRQIVSLSSLHPLNALTFVGLPLPIANAPSNVLQSLFIGHLIANPELIYPGPESVARERLLDELTSRESRLREQGLDPYVIGQRLFGKNNSDIDYQEELYSYLKLRGVVPEDGRNFVEEWRIRGRNNSFLLQSIWKEIERRGDERKWLEGVRTEEEWVDLLDRLVEWGRTGPESQ